MIQINESPVVVPVDFSEACANAVQSVIEGADADAIHLVHVMHPGLHMAYGDMGVLGVSAADDEKRLAATRKYFNDYLADRGLSHLKSEIRIGDPGGEIVDYAESIRAGLIVIPSHGFHGFRRMMIGSVAERVIRLAECSVLVLRRSDAE